MSPSHARARMNGWSKLNAQILGCTRCPRLRAHCAKVAREKKREVRDQSYWGRPVPGFGDRRARLLIVGLAPAAHGANRTGRMFTGDSSGRWLFRALYRAGFANQPTSEHRRDALRLRDAFITAVARCAPPGNKPMPREIKNCSEYLRRELCLLPNMRVVVALGRIAFDQSLRVLRPADLPRKPKFSHGLEVSLGPTGPIMLACYHPSRQNTQTGRLTEPMLDKIFRCARQLVATTAGPIHSHRRSSKKVR